METLRFVKICIVTLTKNLWKTAQGNKVMSQESERQIESSFEINKCIKLTSGSLYSAEMLKERLQKYSHHR